jgi:5,6-dimethylbenzimidazole synthase
LDLYEALRLRVASHEFSEKQVPKELLLRMLKAGSMAPSPENQQPWEFVIIQKEDTKKELTRLKLESRAQVLKEWFPGIGEEELQKRLQRNKKAMETAPVFIAVCYKNLDSAAEVGDLKTSMSLIAAWTCTAYIWLAATAEGLGLSPTFYSHRFYEQAKTVVGVPAGYELASVLRVGYPRKKPLGRKKSILPLESKLHEELF